ncbi:MAG: 50S ribosomal protein L13 [Cytophagales bacterium]|nr:MAG: 50S ribosomal protein L13 [Cytophagales bacterium]TAF61888.1 MAG: 50S ribosomal protein L13 [Cytophagales bacterium]
MDSLSYKTQFVTKASIKKSWLLVNADSMVLGRMASQVARLLMGKHKTSYTPNMDCGDNVIIINAGKVRLTGKKMTDKQIIRHTGYPGGQRIESPKEILAGKRPEKLVELAVRRMLPKNRLGRQMYSNLHVFVADTHNHEAQQPKEIKLV